MSVQVPTEGEVMQEATQVLLEHLSPAKVVRFWASWHVGHGDYLTWRDQAFAGETVTDLYKTISEFQLDQPG